MDKEQQLELVQNIVNNKLQTVPTRPLLHKVGRCMFCNAPTFMKACGACLLGVLQDQKAIEKQSEYLYFEEMRKRAFWREQAKKPQPNLIIKSKRDKRRSRKVNN